ncbi:MAG: hypothetical protein LBS89_04175 [Zoogloeaceae bacterium]|jgi:hypothetical protein|nr:hypothetical protein [Zoogloeaceae bacterium]
MIFLLYIPTAIAVPEKNIITKQWLVLFADNPLVGKSTSGRQDSRPATGGSADQCVQGVGQGMGARGATVRQASKICNKSTANYATK